MADRPKRVLLDYGDGKLVDVTDLGASRYEQFLILTLYIAGKYLERSMLERSTTTPRQAFEEASTVYDREDVSKSGPLRYHVIATSVKLPDYLRVKKYATLAEALPTADKLAQEDKDAVVIIFDEVAAETVWRNTV